MNRVNAILKDQEYRDCCERIRACEKDRIFCHHDMTHFCDVARLALILSLKEGISLNEELIYATAMLHDVGRFLQYENGTPHEQASARIAPAILKRCGFTEEEQEQILDAILSHRSRAVAGEKSLRGYIYRADKMSRSCFGCPAQQECDWSEEKKNLRIVY